MAGINRETVGKVVIVGGLVAVMSTLSIGVILISNYDRERNNLYQKTSIKADVDGNRATTHEEWAQVYKQLGLHFDVYTSSPKKDLTANQLEKYLSQ